MSVQSPKVMLRMGSHAEKEYFVKTADRFDGLMFGANLLESTSGATASLVCKLCGNSRAPLPYYIDPMTYAFGTYFDAESGIKRKDLDWIKSDQKAGRKFKRSYRLLAEHLGPAFDDAVQQSMAIQSSQLTEPEFVRRVLEYQHVRLREVFEADDELQDFVDDIPLPAALLAPYFYQEPENPSFDLSVTLELIRVALNCSFDVPIHAVICGDVKHLEDEDYLESLAAGLQEVNPPGVWLWFSKFDEYRASQVQLDNFRDLVARLGEKREVYNMHGSFYSLALWHFGLTGIMHGVGYGEQKDVVPIIGQSLPWVSYYLPPSRSKLSVANIERSFRTLGIRSASEFHTQVCDCAICRGVLGGDIKNFQRFGDTKLSKPESKRISQTPAAAKRCRFHFLLSRMQERKVVEKSTAASIAESLEKAHTLWTKPNHMKSELGHLLRWKNALLPEQSRAETH